ncbi:RseA family anti-sigma factor [Marinomonas sp. TI.3.20]|uniref:sigma-E factor negative regulatory protein n=1 Tax=Marinomonas sp. TI.3.20 TaxID=3121296 RepID=UPI00311EA679
MTTSNDSKQAVLESLSAMFDDEANEQDLHDLLKQDSAELNKQMEAFHLIQQSLRKDSGSEAEIDHGFNFAERVSLQLDEEMHQSPANNLVALMPMLEEKIIPKKRPLWAGFAIAASVAFVVVLGGDLILDTGSTSTTALAAKTTPNNLHTHVASLSDLKKQPMDANNLRLKNYLRQHAEQATMTAGQGMIPMARIASYPTKKE